MFTFLFRCCAYLPLPWLHGIGALLGRLVLRISAPYRKHLYDNLAQAGFSDPRLARRAAAEAGKSVLELPWVWLRPQRDILARTTTRNWHLVEQARAAGRGVVFLTPHLGCFEVTAQHYATNEKDASPITVLYRPPRKTWLRPLMESARARGHLKLAPADLTGVRRLVRALKRGEAVGLLPDQVPSMGEGVWAPHFGRAAYTMTLPAKLVELTNATPLLAHGERLPGGRGWVVHIHAFEGQLTGSPEQRATAVNQEMERIVRLQPDQYFWGYNRYKRPRGVTPPESGA